MLSFIINDRKGKTLCIAAIKCGNMRDPEGFVLVEELK